MPGLKRSVSGRKLEQNVKAAMKSVTHAIESREEKEVDRMYDEIVKHLKTHREDIKHTHEYLFMKKESDGKTESAEIEFSAQYNSLKSTPKGVLYNDMIPRMHPELRTDLLKKCNKTDDKACHKLLYMATCLHADHPFGPKTRNEFVEVYIDRARRQGDLLRRVIVDEECQIQWETFGLYWLSLSSEPTTTRVADGLCFDTIHIGTFSAPMGHRAVGVDKSWKVLNNWLLHEARLVDENGKRGMTCFEFFEGVPGFSTFATPLLAFEEEDDVKGKRKAKIKWRYVDTEAAQSAVRKVATAAKEPVEPELPPPVSARFSALLGPSNVAGIIPSFANVPSMDITRTVFEAIAPVSSYAFHSFERHG
eukprot:6479891-Amphidinium_carterae.2